MKKDKLAILTSIAAIIGVCIAAIELIPAFGQWLLPKSASPATSTQVSNFIIDTPAPTGISSPSVTLTPGELPANPTATTTTTGIITTIDLTMFPSGIVQTATLAKGAYHEYKLVGITNVPALITVETPDSNLGFQVEIFDTLDKQLAKGGNDLYGNLVLPFTPPENGEYIVRITGLRDFGNYNIRFEYIDEEAQRDRQAITIEIDSVYSDRLARNAYDAYKLVGTANVPILITVETPDSNLGFQVEIFDTLERQLARGGNDLYGNLSLPFTPPEDGEYILRVTGLRDFGSYKIRVESIN